MPTDTTAQCTAAANQKGEHIPCDSTTDHGGPHTNREFELIWQGRVSAGTSVELEGGQR